MNLADRPTFEAANPIINVKLGKKKIGLIKFDDANATWAYYPGGKKKHKGEDFTSLQACKDSVTGDDEKEDA